MGLLIYLLCLLWAVPVILCGTLNLTSPGQYAVLGSEFSFTCTTDTSVRGLLSFMREDAISFSPVCRVYVATGNKTSGDEGFLCSDVEGQSNTYSLTIRIVSRQDSTVWQCQGGGMMSNYVTLDVQYPPTVEIRAVTPCSGFKFLVNQSDVALNCTVTGGNPAPTTFTWYHGDVSLQNGSIPSYTIPRVTRSSGGRYRCTANNGISPPGEDDVKVYVNYPPSVRVNETNRVVRESEDLTIQCTADAKPKVQSVVWTKAGAGGQISDNGILRLKNIQKADAGVYVCTATNKVRSCSRTRQNKSSSASVTLEVQYPPTVKIHAVTPCSGFKFLVNENVALNCTVKGGNPAPSTFTWYHGDVSLQSGPSPIYTISRVTRSSGGWYRCAADNGISPPGEDGVEVDVHYPPIVSVNGSKRVVNETEDLTIQCTPGANPNVTSVVWTKAGVGAQISDSGTLHLKRIQKKDEGEYVCTATNIVTSCSGRPQNKSSSGYVTLEVQYAPQVEHFGVTSGTRNTTVKEHDSVTLKCDIRSNPASAIDIRNKTSSIVSSKTSNSELHEMSRQTLTMMLPNVACLEGGNYTCTAGNLIGQASQTVSLQVLCVPRRDSSDDPVFTSSLHENVTLSLTVIAFPQPTFTWSRKRNARPINTTEVTTEGVRVTGSVTIFDVREEDYINYTVTVSNTEGVRVTGSVTIFDVREEDYTIYTVTVSNTEGQLELEIPLVPKSQPHKPNNLKAMNIRPRSVTLRWEKAFNGGAKQRFNVQYRQPGGQWTTHPTSLSEDETLQLDIDGLEPGTVYEIRINAQNKYGASDYTGTIDVETESENSSGVPIYVLVITCVTSVLLTAALYKAVAVGWTRRKSSTQPVATTEREGNYEATTEREGNYEAITRDMNVGENAYCSMDPVEAAVYVNTNDKSRPTSSTSAASRESQSPNTYYSNVTDSAL